MTRIVWPLASLLVAGLAGPALASPCGDQIAALEKRVKAEATEAISASTSGKATAGAREGQGVTGSTGGQASVPEAPPEKSAQAGQGGDRAQQAKVALDEARTADKKGDASACEAAIGRAKQQLQAAP
ncbi:hypothetical protein [Methylobacterium planeticum]|uniref:Uncharacterized protein n=1 Tax=Methylobacterium planeticum TaxID=2615211 RepID=A0A6N6MXN0_9HYPH|nr:hypothetical protein [Methylobacterium planeticum]KAB1075596.1 hypothetical protein F6X51_02630 [Methylobacterium planeticum]